MLRILFVATLVTTFSFAAETIITQDTQVEGTSVLAELATGMSSRLEGGLTDGLFMDNYLELGIRTSDLIKLSYRQGWSLFIGDNERKGFNDGFLGGRLGDGFLRFTKNDRMLMGDEARTSYEVRQYLPTSEFTPDGFLTSTAFHLKVLSARAGVTAFAFEWRPQVVLWENYDRAGTFFYNELRVGPEFQVTEALRISFPFAAYSGVSGQTLAGRDFSDSLFGGVFFDPTVEYWATPNLTVGGRFQSASIFHYDGDSSEFDVEDAFNYGLLSAFLRVAL